MEKTTMRTLLRARRVDQSGVAALNVSNMETIAAALAAADALDTAVILQIAPMQRQAQGFSYAEIAAITQAVAQRFTRGSYCLHLDHCDTVEECCEAAKGGFDSVMLDKSEAPLEENIRETARLRALLPDICIEAELGHVGGAEGTDGGNDSLLTQPEQAADFMHRTGADCLAIAIGNVHGVYRRAPKLDFARLSAIAAIVPEPLVLHGASGISDDDLWRAVSLGICKVNFFTMLDTAYCDALRQSLERNEKMMYAQRAGQDAMQQQAQQLLAVCAGIKKGG